MEAQESLERQLRSVIGSILALPAPQQVIALDFDNTCIRGDIGEALQARLIQDLALPLRTEDLKAIGGARFAESIAPYLSRLRGNSEEKDPSLAGDKVKEILSAEYRRILKEEDHQAGYTFSVRLLSGLQPEQVSAQALKVFAEGLKAPLPDASTSTPPGAGAPTGLRIYTAMRQFVTEAQELGIRVLVISASCHWAVAPIAKKYFAIPEENIRGIRAERDPDGRILPQCIPPVTYGPGKVEAIAQLTGQKPAFAAGDARTDLEMLRAATLGALVIDRGDAMLRREARKRAWILHPQQDLI